MVQVAMTDIKTYIGGGTSWQAVKTGAFTAAAGQGVFVNTTSSAFTITLPAGTIGDEVSIIDYAGTFDSNNCTIAANGSEKIHGSTDDLTVATERAGFTLVFTDSTHGWLLKEWRKEIDLHLEVSYTNNQEGKYYGKETQKKF